jgi:hypothetical protein
MANVIRKLFIPFYLLTDVTFVFQVFALESRDKEHKLSKRITRTRDNQGLSRDRDRARPNCLAEPETGTEQDMISMSNVS